MWPLHFNWISLHHHLLLLVFQLLIFVWFHFFCGTASNLIIEGWATVPTTGFVDVQRHLYALHAFALLISLSTLIGSDNMKDLRDNIPFLTPALHALKIYTTSMQILILFVCISSAPLPVAIRWSFDFHPQPSWIKNNWRLLRWDIPATLFFADAESDDLKIAQVIPVGRSLVRGSLIQKRSLNTTWTAMKSWDKAINAIKWARCSSSWRISNKTLVDDRKNVWYPRKTQTTASSVEASNN